MGRKSDYTKNPTYYDSQVRECKKKGLNDVETCKVLGINTNTFYAWLNRYANFATAHNIATLQCVVQVENALLKRALGYDYEEITEEITNEGKTTVKRVRKHQAASTSAIIFMLTNLDHENWKRYPDRLEILHQHKAEIREAEFIDGLKGLGIDVGSEQVSDAEIVDGGASNA